MNELQLKALESTLFQALTNVFGGMNRQELLKLDWFNVRLALDNGERG